MFCCLGVQNVQMAQVVRRKSLVGSRTCSSRRIETYRRGGFTTTAKLNLKDARGVTTDCGFHSDFLPALPQTRQANEQHVYLPTGHREPFPIIGTC
ncbi:hypothetical protein BaRGS_00003456 [Batillaria attramentaria]|uniref:Uncharacterized protein n=1 Tax=Batillaria attramentaria TaxID=370345 RepID=A0ABD0M028_9CAEN